MNKRGEMNKSLAYGMPAAMIVAAGLLLVLLWSVHPARADTTFTVSSSADTGGSTCGSGCTLRQAITAANAAPGEDTIVFDLGQSQTITLRSGRLVAADSDGLIIDGKNTNITVSGGGQDSIFAVDRGADLTLQNLIVSDGNASNDVGAGALNLGAR